MPTVIASSRLRGYRHDGLTDSLLPCSHKCNFSRWLRLFVGHALGSRCSQGQVPMNYFAVTSQDKTMVAPTWMPALVLLAREIGRPTQSRHHQRQAPRKIDEHQLGGCSAAASIGGRSGELRTLSSGLPVRTGFGPGEKSWRFVKRTTPLRRGYSDGETIRKRPCAIFRLAPTPIFSPQCRSKASTVSLFRSPISRDPIASKSFKSQSARKDR